MLIGIVGVGLIGSYVAVRLSAAGHELRLVGRQVRDVENLRRLRAIDLKGHTYEVAAALDYRPDPAYVHGCDFVVVATKSSATNAVSASLRSVLSPDTPVLSFQNGLTNPGRMLEHGLKAFGCVVTFNVRQGSGRAYGDRFEAHEFAQTTSGPLVFATLCGTRPEQGLHQDRDLPGAVLDAFGGAGLEWKLSEDFPASARAKLLLNLINGLCAATGMSVAETIGDRRTRRIYAQCIREGLRAFAAHGEAVKPIGLLAPGLIARFLPLPDALVRVLARPMIQIDPRARSSTLVDLEAGRRTEIAELNGAIVDKCVAAGLPHRANNTIVDCVRVLEAAAVSGKKLEHIGPQALYDRIFAQ